MKAEALRQHTRYTEWLIDGIATSGKEDSYLDLATAAHNYEKLNTDELKLDWLKNITAKNCVNVNPSYYEDEEEEEAESVTESVTETPPESP